MNSITFKAPPYSLKEYRDFCWASNSTSKKSVYIASALAFLILTAIVCVKVFCPFASITYISILLFIIGFIAALIFLWPFYFRIAMRNTYKSFNNSENSLIELSEDYVKCSSSTEKINLPKNQINKIFFSPAAVYIYYNNKAVLILKSYFKSDTDWENVLRFIKENYSKTEIDNK